MIICDLKLFQMVFDPRSSTAKGVFNCHISSVIIEHREKVAPGPVVRNQKMSLVNALFKFQR